MVFWKLSEMYQMNMNNSKKYLLEISKIGAEYISTVDLGLGSLSISK